MKRSLLTFLAPFVFAGSLHAAADYFLEIDGIKGESADRHHPETIEIESFSWGASHTSGGTGAGKVSFSDLHCTMKVSKATPQLLVACADGSTIAKATLYVRREGEETDYYMIVVENVLVSSLRQVGPPQTSTAGDDPPPTEEVAFYYNKIAIAHVGEDGTTTKGEAIRTPEQ